MRRKLAILSFITLLPVWGAVCAQGGILQGRVYDEITNEPLGFATVILEGTSTGAYTDSLGAFVISGIEPGLYNLSVSYTGYKSRTIYELQVSNSKPVDLEIGLEVEAKEVEGVEISASPFNKTLESPVSIRTIGVNEIERNPGGNRDISKAIQSLPGVASSVGFRNDIIIRGGAPNENRFYLDGIEVPNINHFATQGASGGPVGLINVNFIREVDFYSGAFPSNRGNSLSSVLEFKQKTGRTDRIGANITLGSSDLGVTLEGPMGKRSSFMFSARRSYLQFLFKALALPFLPNYNDFQYKQSIQIGKKDRLTIIGLGAIDEFALNLEADSTDQQRYILGNLPVNTQWNYTIGANYQHFTKNGYYTVVLSRNMLNNRAFKYQNNDDSVEENLVLDYTSREIENKFRLENTSRFSGYKLNIGINAEQAKYTNNTYNVIATPVGNQVIDFDSKLTFYKYGLFGQLSRQYLDDRLGVSVGIRLDGNTFSNEMNKPWEQFSPRFSATYALSEKFNLNFNTGRYFQLPPYTVLGYRSNTGELINKSNQVTYIRSDHLVAGVEYNYKGSGKVTLEGFYKDYANYPFMLDDSVSLANLGADFGVVGNGPAVSTSKGRAYGFELLVQQKLFKGFYGILAYTFVASEFTDKSGTYRPSAWDNRHILSFTGGKRFGKNWEVGAKFRMQGGSPYTPYDVGVSSLITSWDVRGAGILDYDQVNSRRLSLFHQLDLRIDKKYYFKNWSLNLYFDVQNVYGFESEAPPYLDVVRDDQGNPIVDPNDPTKYQMRLIENRTGSVLPTLGVVIEI